MRGIHVMKFGKNLVKFSLFGPHSGPHPAAAPMVPSICDSMHRARWNLAGKLG